MERPVYMPAECGGGPESQINRAMSGTPGKFQILSEKPSLKMDIQLTSTTKMQPTSPVKNIHSRMYILQTINLKPIAATDQAVLFITKRERPSKIQRTQPIRR